MRFVHTIRLEGYVLHLEQSIWNTDETSVFHLEQSISNIDETSVPEEQRKKMHARELAENQSCERT